MNIIYEHRLGAFNIPSSSVAREGFKLLSIFGRCVVVKCDFDYATDSFRYEALSPDFDSIAMGKPAPLYSWLINTDGRGEVVRVEAVRQTPL